MGKKKAVRTSDFLWESKQELYSYFTEKHDVSEEEIDREIERVMSGFRLRQGQSIKTQELWQKVGLNLAKKKEDNEILDKWESILAARKENQAVPPSMRETQKLDLEDLDTPSDSAVQESSESDDSEDDDSTEFFEVDIP